MNNDELRAQISALMDGEAPRDTARFLAQRLAADPGLRGDWMRWHHQRDCLQGHAVSRLDDAFAARIAAAIAAEAAPGRPLGAQILKWAGGMAVAASVALLAILLVPTMQTGQTPADAGLAQQASVPTTATAPAQVASSGLTEADLRPSLAPAAQTVSRSSSLPWAPAVKVDPRMELWVLRHQGVRADPLGYGAVSLLPVTQPPVPASVVVESEPNPSR